MITRLVKMELNDEFTIQFPLFFKNLKSKIEAFEGCLEVSLQQDIHQKNTFFTISKWNSETDLNNYRDSELFIETWKTVKPNFTEKAVAWSLETP